MNPKLKTRAEIASLCDRLREQGKRLAFTNGCFDLLHVGHVRYLKAARAQGDALVVGLNSDSSVRELKGETRPLMPEDERAEVLSALDCVDYVVVFPELRPFELLKAVKPHVHVKGGDYRVEDLPEAPLVRSLGGEVVVVPVVPGRSTTNLIRTLAGAIGEGAPRPDIGARAVAIIPARYASTRLEAKALVDIGGKPMIQHVYERATEAEAVEDVWVATDDERILRAVEAFGGKAQMTSADHQSGTDRVAEVAANLDCELVVNIQGDEPFLDPDDIDRAVAPLREDPTLDMSTLKVRITDAVELDDPNSVKVVTDANGMALYFSREPIPHHRDGGERRLFKHIGLYVYRRSFLLSSFRETEPSLLERTERLEQLRVLEHGHRIRVVETPNDSIGVDTPEDLERVRRMFADERRPCADARRPCAEGVRADG